MHPAIVLTFYRLPLMRLADYFAWNVSQFQAAGAVLYVVCDPDTYKHGRRLPATLTLTIRWLPFPEELTVCWPARTSNYGIRKACGDGHHVILKTDPDVVYPGGSLHRILAATDTLGNCPQCYFSSSYDERETKRPIGLTSLGTLCLTAETWQRVQGYDERCFGWGWEDLEIVDRLQELGVELNRDETIVHIRHENRRQFNPDRRRVNRQFAARQPGLQPNWGQYCKDGVVT